MNNKTTDLYRHYNKNDELLYVGISLSAINRFIGHKSKDWIDEVSRVTIEKFETRELALIAECKAIQSEKPKFNIRHNKLKKNYKLESEKINKKITKHNVMGEWQKPSYKVKGKIWLYDDARILYENIMDSLKYDERKYRFSPEFNEAAKHLFNIVSVESCNTKGSSFRIFTGLRESSLLKDGILYVDQFAIDIFIRLRNFNDIYMKKYWYISDFPNEKMHLSVY